MAARDNTAAVQPSEHCFSLQEQALGPDMYAVRVLQAPTDVTVEPTMIWRSAAGASSSGSCRPARIRGPLLPAAPRSVPDAGGLVLRGRRLRREQLGLSEQRDDRTRPVKSGDSVAGGATGMPKIGRDGRRPAYQR